MWLLKRKNADSQPYRPIRDFEIDKGQANSTRVFVGILSLFVSAWIDSFMVGIDVSPTVRAAIAGAIVMVLMLLGSSLPGSGESQEKALKKKLGVVNLTPASTVAERLVSLDAAIFTGHDAEDNAEEVCNESEMTK
ncbi:MAG: hypothetical protein FWE20_10865 [Defluviitaleaceae bacterium]|nr:hypothetical protein [Defluviitaleaceae bacterium]